MRLLKELYLTTSKKLIVEDDYAGISLHHDIPDDLQKALKKDPEVGPYVRDLNSYKAIYLGDTPIGTLRIDVNPKADSIKVGSVFMLPQYRGKGYAKSAIELAIKNKPAYTFIAPYNNSSKSLFKKLGFKYYRTTEYENEPLEIWKRD